MNYNPNIPYVQPPVQPPRPRGTIAPSILAFIFSLVNFPLMMVGLFWIEGARLEAGYYIVAFAALLCVLAILLGAIGLLIGIVRARAGAIVFAALGLVFAGFEIFVYSEWINIEYVLSRIF